jgi:molybdate transport system substrate-binding protein
VSRWRRGRRGIGVLVVGVLATAWLLGGPSATGQAAAPVASTTPSGTITVSAASSLTDVLPVIAQAFQKRYPGTTVRMNFGGSSTLVAQVMAGAPVDVLATASEPTMWKAVNAGVVSKPLLFAKNTMAVVMPADNPARITTLSDLGRPGVLVGLCEVTVPCGAAAKEVLTKARVTVTPVTRELEVRALLGKVMSGELDAGIVYVTDVKAAGAKVTSMPIPASVNAVTTYPVATVGDTANPVLARTFVNYLRYSPSAQGILRAYGFGKPW